MGLFTKVTIDRTMNNEQFKKFLRESFNLSPSSALNAAKVQWNNLWIDYHNTMSERHNQRRTKALMEILGEATEVVVDRMAKDFTEKVEEELINKTD